MIDQSIPETVFTTNITFLLSRENKAGSKKTKTPQILKENVWMNRLAPKKKKTSSNCSSPTTSPAPSLLAVTPGLQKSNEILQARINALEEEKASNASTSSQSVTSNSTNSAPAEDTMIISNRSGLTLESVQKFCERMFSERMPQLERKQRGLDPRGKNHV